MHTMWSNLFKTNQDRKKGHDPSEKRSGGKSENRNTATSASQDYETVKIKTTAPKDSLSARLSNGSRPARNTDAKKAGSETLSNIFPFSNHFSGLDGTNSKDRKLEDFKFISDMFISISKTEFAPWTVYLQHGKTGVIAAFFSGIFSRNLGYKKSDTSLLISIWFTIQHFLSSVSTGKTC